MFTHHKLKVYRKALGVPDLRNSSASFDKVSDKVSDKEDLPDSQNVQTSGYATAQGEGEDLRVFGQVGLIQWRWG